MKISKRQQEILEIVKGGEPITGDSIAERLNLTRASLRSDLAFLVQIGHLEARPRVGYFYVNKKPYQTIIDKIMKLRVRDFLSVPVVVSENTVIYDAIVALFVNDVGTLFVVSEGEILEGIVSRKDLLKTTLGKVDINQVPVSVIMTRMPNVITTTMEEGLWHAGRKICSHEVDALPVVKEITQDKIIKYKVVGRLSKTNITKAFVDFGLGKFGSEEENDY
ncbi:helix-turn-helix transcriptional regulator [Desulfonispora thiosulfatigenes]|uniref:helix-turn-helix transcriptional regulator n=1 Tax=Desulfonispora thiosulfatigenes TaxID=83661 RepID=UPI000A04CC7F